MAFFGNQDGSNDAPLPSRDELIRRYMTYGEDMPLAAAERAADLMLQLGSGGPTNFSERAREDPATKALRAELGALNKQYFPVHENGGLGGFLSDAGKAVVGGVGTLATNPAVLGALGGVALTGGFGGLGGIGAGEAAIGGSAPYIGAGGSAAAGATPALLGETALAPVLGGTAAAGAGAGLLGSGGLSPTEEAAQFGYAPPAAPSEGLFNLPAAGGGAGVASGTALSRIIDGTANTADWAQVLGTAGATGLGVYGSMREGDRLSNLQQQMRADRAPYLAAGTNYLDPQKWIEGPGQAFTKGTLQQLSATHGNPISSPTALGIATDASMRNWLGGVNTLGSLGLGGQGIQAQLGSQAAGAYGDIYGNIGGGISDIVNPRRSLADLMREYRGVIA